MSEVGALRPTTPAGHGSDGRASLDPFQTGVAVSSMCPAADPSDHWTLARTVWVMVSLSPVRRAPDSR